MLIQLRRLSSSLREPFDIDHAYLQRKSILQTYVKPRNSPNLLDGSELARRIVPQWDKASVDLRQAYKKFVEAVGELVGGGVPTEEFHELAVTVYHLFGVPEEKFEADKKTSEKKLLLQKVLGVPISDSNLQKVATVAHNVYKLQPDDQRTSLGVDVYAIESDEI